LKKTTKKQRKILTTNKETIMNHIYCTKQWNTWKKSGKNTWKKSGKIMNNDDKWHI
jgi:hypothetical protein